MKYIIAITIGFALSACSLYSPKKAPEIVASCFSDGEDQEKMCKAQRVNEDNKIVVTRCIGKQNREASPALRGKCVEKICAEGSNTDCLVKGEIRVLEQYSELVTSSLFGDGDSAPVAKKPISNKEKKHAKTKVAAKSDEVDTDPSVSLPPASEKKPIVEATPPPAPQKVLEEASAAPAISIALKPAKSFKKKTRSSASIKTDEGFKKVCVAKNDTDAPEVLRGKCATRNCHGGKCNYKGRKEMFDYLTRTSS